MGSDIFVDESSTIHRKCSEEYYSEYSYFEGILWRSFIMSKDIGLDFMYDDLIKGDIYKIVDERKWMLTRIKYGI